ncbi:uncharacterized protein A1O9_10165 [Exophiala aquamarina CBS 119918]|uniref:Uncharacterized protein n=1 Tax=Exophiala aquamarina CBS 119918 TaxID=1182545 RepID=A0A072P0Y4_9EURO|nr:uncharacterized protein A1O9_10165 [Exophiala aquamarina CBS 119918]KEF53764.1 hypothetical protein A1O9_10165 [Exophiala aquamarina CBS 119918]
MAESGKPIMYGRGGAGNVTTKKEKVPSPNVETTPTLKSKMYTTGRGGTGNMAKNDPERPEEARRAQDVDIPGLTLPEGSHHTGRGGAANKYTPSEIEQQQARMNNEKVRSESFRRSGSKERGGIRALADKAKDAVTGKHNEK